MTTRQIATIYQGLPYGWSVLFALQVEGMQFLFTEAEVGGTDPTGYTQVPGSLIVEGSPTLGSVADLARGVAKSFDLAVTLRRNATTQPLFARPTAITRLTADLADTETSTIEVEDQSGFSSSGIVYIGRESIAYAFKTSTTELNGLTRGSPNGTWKAYDHPITSQVSTWVTDSPLYWRGRMVRLWAVPVDPYGRHQGSDLLDDAAEVWVGHIHAKPEPNADGWELTCEPLVRRLSTKVGAPVSGRATWDLVADPYVEIDEQWTINVGVRYSSSPPYSFDFEMDVTPFASTAASPLSGTVRLSQARASIKAEWDAQVTAIADAQVGALQWIFDRDEIESGDTPVTRIHRATYEGSHDGTVGNDTVHVVIQITNGHVEGLFVPGNESGGYLITTNDVPATSSGSKLIETNLLTQAAASVASLKITVSEGDPTELPSTGWIQITAGDKSVFYEYSDLYVDGNIVTVQTAPGSGPALEAFAQDALEQLADGTLAVKFAIRDEGPYRDMMRRMLASSGRGDNDATYDTLPLAGGYDIAEVDFDAFDVILDGGWNLVEGEVQTDETISFEDIYGRLLALSARCIVTRPSADGSLELAPIRTSVYDTGLAESVTITDDDLVVVDNTPVRRASLPRSPNLVQVRFEQGGERVDGELNIPDVHDRRRDGERSISIKAQGVDRTTFDPVAIAWARTLFLQGHDLDAYELDVMPGTDVQPGDSLNLVLTHYSMWDRETGDLGYTGPARCIGRQLDPVTSVLTLTVVTQGTYRAMALSPSAPVLSFSGTPGIGDTINIAEEYEPLMSAYLASGGGSFTMIAYEPSLDDATKGYTFDAVEISGGVLRMTVSALFNGGVTLSTDHYLTLPVTASGNDAQDRHLHTDTEGAVWR